jgi:hypothetical protein
MTALAVIDGDILAYRCAAANEKRTVKAVHKETLEEHVFDTATKFKEWAGSDVGDYDLTPHQEADELKYAFAMMKQMLGNITEGAKCDSYHVVVSGDNNFRSELPLPTRYKDSRKASVRPLQLAECKQYLITHQEAEVAVGEADDLLTAYMYQGYRDKEYIVQCSLDKDAKHGAGWLYDWTTMKEPELIEGYGGLELILKETARKKADGSPVIEKSVKGKGRAFLFYQMVFGDPVDSYKPCELAKVKFGEIGAYELLKNCKTDKEAVEALVRQYKIWYPEPVTYRCWNNELHTKDWLEIMQMYADCSFMRRWDGDKLDVKKLLTKLGVEH